jgi:endonuclease
MRLVVARCSATYEGRLSSTLTSGVRLLMVKADGCVAIHADIGAYKPINWMNAPNTLHEEPGRWTVTNPRGERLVIDLEEVLDEVVYELDIDRGLVLDGVERELQALLAANPHHLEPGLACVQREFRTDLGPIDCSAEPRPARRSRRGQAGRARSTASSSSPATSSVSSATRCCDRCAACSRRPGSSPRPGCSAESRGIGWVEIDVASLRGEDESQPRLF